MSEILVWFIIIILADIAYQLTKMKNILKNKWTKEIK